MGDSIFTFRMKHPQCAKMIYSEQKLPLLMHDNASWTHNTILGLPIENDGYMYGVVFFRQRRDSSRKRGYFQVGFLCFIDVKKR